jgi:hypothetical protein
MKPLLSLLFLTTFASHAVEFIVDTTTDSIDFNPGDGFCQDSNGQCSLRAAVQETNSLLGADIIYLSRFTTYSLNLNAGASDSDFGDLDINDSLTISIESPLIAATSVAELPLIFGNSLDRVFDISLAENVTLNALQITGGDASVNVGTSHGGAIYIDGTVVNFNLLNSVLSFNKANVGGAIHSYAQTSLISFTDISYNELSTGANNAEGAAIMNRSGNMTIQYSTIHHNSIDDLVMGCSQAIFNLNSEDDLYLFSTSVNDNGISSSGVKCVNGVSAQNSHLYLVNTTINNNGGSGITFFDFMPDDKQLFVRNSIIANNHFQNCFSINTGLVNFGDAEGGHNISSDLSCALPMISGNLENTDPKLDSVNPLFVSDPLYFLYYEPLPTSPAIDNGSELDNTVGNPNACTLLDQLLRTRPIDGNGDSSARCDIGAVEYNYDLIFKNSFDQL